MPSVTHKVIISDILKVDNQTLGDGGYLFRFSPNNPVSQVGVFKYSTATKHYHYLYDIEMS